MNHPSSAYGKALMKQDNKRSTLDPVQPANRHRNVGRQALPDVPPGNPAAVATTQRQKEAREKAATERLPERGSPVGVPRALPQEEAGEERLPEWGSPVGVQQALPQEEAAREAGEEGLPERGSPVEAQLKLCQEESWAGARKRPGECWAEARKGPEESWAGARKRPGECWAEAKKGPEESWAEARKGPEESWAEARERPEAEMEKACGKTGGNGEGEQESCGNGDKRPAGIAASREEREDLVREVEDEGNEDGPQYETRSQAGHPVFIPRPAVYG